MSVLKELALRTLPPGIIRVLRSVRNRLRAFEAIMLTFLVRTRVRHWRKVAFGKAHPWDARNRIIADAIPAGASVLDLGCGLQTLRRHLKAGCRYQPCDIIKSAPEVLLCDFNSGVYPELKERFDFAVCSGVFEFLRDPAEFLKMAPQLGRVLVLSYNPVLPGQSRLKRRELMWVNHFRRQDLEALFQAAQLECSPFHISVTGEITYALRKREPVEIPSSSSHSENRGR